MCFQVWEYMAVWRGHIRWKGRVFKHIKVQISQLPLCSEQVCVRRRCPGEMTVLLTASSAAWDQCLLHFVQGRCVLACYHRFNLSEVVDGQYPILSQKTDVVALEADVCVRNFYGWGEPLCLLHSLDCSFVCGSHKCFQVSSIVTIRAKKPAVVRLQCSRISCEATTDHAADPHSFILASIWQRAFSCPTHHGWWTQHSPKISPESVLSLWLKFSDLPRSWCERHPNLKQGDYKWSCCTVFIFTAELSCLN